MRRASIAWRLSRRALTAHRLRTALCIAGTATGIAGVLVLAAVGEGARRRVLAEVDAMGRDLLVVTAPAVDPRRRVLRRAVALEPALIEADAAALSANATAVVRAAPASDRTLAVRHGRVRTRVSVLSTTPDWLRIRRFALAEGRFFTAAEAEARERVVVLGSQPRRVLFPDSVQAVGKLVRIGTVPFLVVGVLAEEGVSASGTATEDDRVVVPRATATARLFGDDDVSAIYVQLRAAADVDGRAEREVADVLRARRDADRRSGPEPRIDGQRVLLEARLAAQAPLRRMLVTLSAFSLAVVAVGAMATMFLSVRERRGEVGLRIAVGARRRDIVLQFLGEALALALVGGLLGMLAGSGAAVLAAELTRWDARVSVNVIAIAAGSTMLVGVLGGLVPALRAAQLDPVESLRSG